MLEDFLSGNLAVTTLLRNSKQPPVPAGATSGCGRGDR